MGVHVFQHIGDDNETRISIPKANLSEKENARTYVLFHVSEGCKMGRLPFGVSTLSPPCSRFKLVVKSIAFRLSTSAEHQATNTTNNKKAVLWRDTRS